MENNNPKAQAESLTAVDELGKMLENKASMKITKPKKGLIFGGPGTMAETQAAGDDFHVQHFNCINCDLNLTGHRYILREEKPHCIKCYENLFANTCEECKTPIGTDSKDLSYKEQHWHEACFKCIDCVVSLVDQPFASKENKLYCADCYDNNFAARCDGCSNIFRAGMKKYEYRGKQWHEQCFLCEACQKPIGTQSFIPRDQNVCCVPCYEDKYAQRCAKCNGTLTRGGIRCRELAFHVECFTCGRCFSRLADEIFLKHQKSQLVLPVINKGGITYKGTPFHRDCFMCTHCQKLLAGEKFTSKEEQPYCADCFGELFAKKCIKCTKPITGLGGTKFISFEEKHWHSDCFNCYKCNVSLVGRGFLTEVSDILCPECGRN